MSDISPPRGMENIQLRMNTLEKSRQSLTRVIRMYTKGEIDHEGFRDIVYGFAGLLSYWKLEKDCEIEKRLDAIEDALLTGGKG